MMAVRISSLGPTVRPCSFLGRPSEAKTAGAAKIVAPTAEAFFRKLRRWYFLLVMAVSMIHQGVGNMVSRQVPQPASGAGRESGLRVTGRPVLFFRQL